MIESYTDHPEYQFLLAAVRAGPDDDLPRLVLADWLEERGEGERAEFIRDQCAGTRGRINPPRARKWFAPFPWEGSQLAFSTAKHRCLIRQRYGATGTPPNAPAVEVRRGFVHTIRGPLSSLIGGECSRCGPPRALPPYHWVCPDCNGTGRTPGVLRELVRREPVTATGIEVTDREPAEIGGGIVRHFRWWIENPEREPSQATIPAALYAVIEGSHWATAEAARAALSAAILRHATTPIDHHPEAPAGISDEFGRAVHRMHSRE